MRSIQTTTDQLKVCEEFARKASAPLSKRNFTPAKLKKLEETRHQLEQTAAERQGAGEAAEEASGQVSAVAAVAEEKLRLAHVAFRLATREASGKQSVALAPISKMKAPRKVGAARLVAALQLAAAAGAKPSAAQALKELAGWTESDRKELAQLAAELNSDRKQRGTAKGKRGALVQQVKESTANAESALESFKLIMELACAGTPMLDAFYQELRAVEAKVRHRAAKSPAPVAQMAPAMSEEKKVG